MKLTLKLVIGMLLVGFQVHAQESGTQVKSHIAKLNNLVGVWEGTAYFQQGPNQRIEFNQTEHVESKLNGTVLLVEGKGFVKDSLAFNALAIFSYDMQKNIYVIESHLFDGKSTVATGFFREDGSFEWGFSFTGGQVRYVITFDKNNWYETGEFSRDGNQWFKTFEMHLTRKK